MKLVIAEKPSVAQTIAAVLGISNTKSGYIEGNEYLVSWCFGHLIGLAPPNFYDAKYADKQWKFEDLPIMPSQWKFVVNQATKSQYELLKSLMFRNDVTEIICATDAGREGECIFRYVYNLANCHKPVKRLWTSSLEATAIKQGFAELKDDSCYDNLFAAGLARAKADWLVGMNGSRLFSIRYKTNISIGRVQTPTLAMIVDRNYKVTNFIKEKYFQIGLNCGNGLVVGSERIDDESMANNLLALCNGKPAVVTDVKKEIKTTNPPKLYDLTTLQREANRQFGYTAQQTLDYTQALYEAKLVTYPRTDSQYITDDMEQTAINMVQIVQQCFPTFISSDIDFVPNIQRCINNAKVSDHHAIIPTAEIQNINLAELPTGQRNILAFVSAKLLLATGEPHKYETVKIVVTCENHDFHANGKTVVEVGFKALEKHIMPQLKGKNTDRDNEKNNDKALPEVNVGESYPMVGSFKVERYTAPPKQYTEDTLLSAMEIAGNSDYDEDSETEKKGLGTPATRAGIIENLIKKEYIKRDGKKLLPTEKGKSLIAVVPEEVKSPKMTADWETTLQNIEKESASDIDFIDSINNFVLQLIQKYGTVDTASGFDFSREAVGKCPKCGKKVMEFPKSYSCESGKDGCGFVIWKNMCGKSITPTQATKLLSKGKSDLIKGFKNKAGKEFDAYLLLKNDYSIGLDFPKTKKAYSKRR